MPNIWSKLPEIIGAWIGLAISLFLMPLFLLPAFLFGWIMWGWASPAAMYSFIYDKTFMIIIGLALLLLLIWTEGFKASLDDAPALAKFQYETPNPGGAMALLPWPEQRSHRSLLARIQLRGHGGLACCVPAATHA